MTITTISKPIMSVTCECGGWVSFEEKRRLGSSEQKRRTIDLNPQCKCTTPRFSAEQIACGIPGYDAN